MPDVLSVLLGLNTPGVITLTLAYCDVPGYEYDPAGAIAAGKMNVFQMEPSDLTPAANIDSKRFEAELLDGQKWLLPRKHRKQQAFTTNPDLTLTNGEVLTNNGQIVAADGTLQPLNDLTFNDLVTSWFYSRSQWIVTPDISDSSEPNYGLVKVIPASDKVAEKHEDVNFMPKTTITFETAGVY